MIDLPSKAAFKKSRSNDETFDSQTIDLSHFFFDWRSLFPPKLNKTVDLLKDEKIKT